MEFVMPNTFTENCQRNEPMMTNVNDVKATWCSSEGEVESPSWLAPQDGYIRIEPGDNVTISLNGPDALRLHSDLNHANADDIWVLPPQMMRVLAWLEEDWTLDIGSVTLGIDEASCDRLRELLGRLVRNPPVPQIEKATSVYSRKDVNWIK